MLQTLNFNGPRQVNAAGTFFRYESGSAGGADESIRVRADGQDLGLYWPGDSVELPGQRSAWDIIPTTPTAVGVIRVGNGRVNSARLVGRVEVIDSTRSASMAEQAFVNSASVGPNAGKFAQVQIWNATTNKGIELRSVIINPTTSQQTVGIFSHLVKLTGSAIDVTSRRISSTSVGGTNQLLGVQTVREPNGIDATPLGAGYRLFHYQLTSTSQQVQLPIVGAPYVIGPGSGLTLCMQAADQSLSVVFDGRTFDW